MKRPQSPADSIPPVASIIIPTPRDPAVLAAVLASCVHQTDPRYEILLVDMDVATPELTQVVDRYAGRLPLRHRRTENAMTRALGCNHAAESARGPILIFVPDGDLMHPRLVEAHVEACAAAAGGVVILGRRGKLLTHVPPDVPIEPPLALRLASHAASWRRALIAGECLDVTPSVEEIERDFTEVILRLEPSASGDLLDALAAAHGNVLTGHPMAWMFSMTRALHRDLYLSAGGMNSALESSIAELDLHYRLARTENIETRREPGAMTYAYRPAAGGDAASARGERVRLYKDVSLVLSMYRTVEVGLAVRLMFRRVDPGHVERLLRATRGGEAETLLEELAILTCRAAESELLSLLE
jgi:glycosyltransferase involved in cell wall biosynthesis